MIERNWADNSIFGNKLDSIPSSAYGAEPLSAAEIDAHPDSARIWATIAQARVDARDGEDDLEAQHEKDLESERDRAFDDVEEKLGSLRAALEEFETYVKDDRT